MTSERYYVLPGTAAALLPDYYESSQQMKAFAAAVDTQISALYSAMNQLLRCALLTGGAEMLTTWEKQLGLGYVAEACPGTLTEKKRIALLRQYLFRQTPVTEERLRTFLSEVTDTYTLLYDPSVPSLTVTFSVPTASLAWEIERYLKRMLPANLMLTITAGLQTHAALYTRTYAVLHAKTHDALRREI